MIFQVCFEDNMSQEEQLDFLMEQVIAAAQRFDCDVHLREYVGGGVLCHAPLDGIAARM